MKCKACGKEIDEHEVGEGLDECMAKAVMGWHEWDFDSGDYDGDFPMYYTDKSDGVLWWYRDSNDDGQTFTPSRDISHAWAVVKKFTDYEIIINAAGKVPPLCSMLFVENEADFERWYTAEADTVPLAICLAALKARASQRR